MMSWLPPKRALPWYQGWYLQTKNTGSLYIPISRFLPKELGSQALELVQLDGTTFSVASTYHQKVNISVNTARISKIIAPSEWRRKSGTSDIGHVWGEWDMVHSQSVSGGQKEEREKFDPIGRKSAS